MTEDVQPPFDFDGKAKELLTVKDKIKEAHGIVLESARGSIPSLVERIAGGPVRGSWWAHKRSREIWKIIQAVRQTEAILVCRPGNGRIT